MIKFSQVRLQHQNVGWNRIWPRGVHRFDRFLSHALYSFFHPSVWGPIALSMAGDWWVQVVLFGLPHFASRFTITLQRFEAFVADGICQTPRHQYSPVFSKHRLGLPQPSNVGFSPSFKIDSIH